MDYRTTYLLLLTPWRTWNLEPHCSQDMHRRVHVMDKWTRQDIFQATSIMHIDFGPIDIPIPSDAAVQEPRTSSYMFRLLIAIL